MTKLALRVVLVLALVAVASERCIADLVTFDFVSASGVGETLEGLGSSGTVTSSNMGITHSLTATSLIDGVQSGSFNRNTSESGNFGINAPGSGDDTDALDGGLGVESIRFTVTSNVALSSLTLQSFDLDRVTSSDSDSGTFSFAGGTTYTFGENTIDNGGSESGIGIYTIDEPLTIGQEFNLSFVAGGGFGLESLVFDAISAVPEPTAFAFGALITTGLVGLVARRRRTAVA